MTTDYRWNELGYWWRYYDRHGEELAWFYYVPVEILRTAWEKADAR